MKKKMAEITIDMACGGVIKTYIPCKNEKDLLKKLRKIHGEKWADFGHFKVYDESVMFADYNMVSVH